MLVMSTTSMPAPMLSRRAAEGLPPPVPGVHVKREKMNVYWGDGKFGCGVTQVTRGGGVCVPGGPAVPRVTCVPGAHAKREEPCRGVPGLCCCAGCGQTHTGARYPHRSTRTQLVWVAGEACHVCFQGHKATAP